MKFQPSQLPSRKPHFSPRKSSKFAPFIALALLLTVPLYNYPFNIVAEYPSHKYLLSQTVLLEHNNTNLDHDVDDIPCSSGPCNDGGGGGVTLGRREPTGELRLGKGGGKGRVARPREYLERVSTGIKRTKVLEDEKCDLFTGEWVRNPEGPYYTNATCNAIQDHQNCMKYGRPDTGFLKWRWKPDGCDLPIFDPHQFLELVRGKSLAFVGDSVARNHMQSLICLLSRVSYPEDLSGPTDQNKRYQYAEHDFNISMFWSPYLVKTGKLDPNKKRPFDLYLDEFDPHWTTKIALFDYVIISAGHWFFAPPTSM
ncbi:UNVERIFIED_CONTAM: protein trichome birefringence-like 21 [Sesamum radiatum]|uniref:Protein trichome birefringence-like 21 n=1 Tax=Sesamum radiatum TaxID=300843 RepID=A0AAW2RDI2_SESRA